MDPINALLLKLPEFWASFQTWFDIHVLALDNAVQAGFIGLALLLGRILGSRLRRAISTAMKHRTWRLRIRNLVDRFMGLSTPIMMFVFLWLVVEVGSRTALFGHHLTQIAASFVGAWVLVSLLTGYIENQLLARSIAWTAWAMAALVSVGLYGPTLAVLDSVGMTFGQVRISLLSLAKGVLALGVLLWTVGVLSHLFERKIGQSDSLTPSAQVLVVKIIKIALVALAVLMAIGSVGIDLTALTVFGGALGIGIGIGLQKVVSNLVCGLLLLMDKSIKPNDVIAVGGTYGWVASLGARYAAVRTRDGVEYLIPNEEFITQRVENWSHSDKAVRLNIPIGISYRSDLLLAMDLCREAPIGVGRVLSDPPVQCLLRGFGDSSIDLEVRIWIDDPAEGRSNVISQVLLRVWELFLEHGIEIPFPQRDLHLKSSDISLSRQTSEQLV